MNQSLLYHAFGIREGYDYQKTEYVEGRTQFSLKVKPEMLVCEHCKSSQGVIRKGRRVRRVQTLPIGFRETWLLIEVPRCHCRTCGKTFEVSPPLPLPMFTTPEALPGLCKRSRK
jgi:transposase